MNFRRMLSACIYCGCIGVGHSVAADPAKGESYIIKSARKLTSTDGRTGQASVALWCNENGEIAEAAICQADFTQESIAIVAGIPSVTYLYLNIGKEFSLDKDAVSWLHSVKNLKRLKVFSSDKQLAASDWRSLSRLNGLKEISLVANGFPELAFRSLLSGGTYTGNGTVVFEGIVDGNDEEVARLTDQIQRRITTVTPRAGYSVKLQQRANSRIVVAVSKTQ